jgi:predicted nucleic acid-binding protein
MMQMQGKYFIDSNIFLYAFSTKDMLKQKSAKDIVVSKAVISTQVLNEVCVNMIRKLNFAEDQVIGFVESSYRRYKIVEITKDVFLTASNLRLKYQFSYYDSMIISAALQSECEVLYSEDMQHKQVIEQQLQIINPFITEKL